MIPQADEEAPGLIDEALSHHDLEDTEEEDLHHDDIVEHLDVIGERAWKLGIKDYSN